MTHVRVERVGNDRRRSLMVRQPTGLPFMELPDELR